MCSIYAPSRPPGSLCLYVFMSFPLSSEQRTPPVSDGWEQSGEAWPEPPSLFPCLQSSGVYEHRRYSLALTGEALTVKSKKVSLQEINNSPKWPQIPLTAAHVDNVSAVTSPP